MVSATLRFLGGAGTVTGSKFVVETGGQRLLVDCGMFQGLKELRLRNWDPLPIPPASIDAVVLTHGHLDHCGYLPLLCRRGFDGPVYATPGTCRLAEIVLPDSGHLQQEEAEYAARHRYSKHDPPRPLYTEADARRCLDQLTPIAFGEQFEPVGGVSAQMHVAGHILGAAWVELEVAGKRVVFSGDLGRQHHPVLVAPETPPASDVLVLESTYGNRTHDDVGSMQRFAHAIRATSERRGVVVIPAFAVDRFEVILYQLRRLMNAGEIPRLTVYVDSPMGLAALDVYRVAIAQHWPEIRPDLAAHGDPFDPGHLVEVRTVQHSMAINDRAEPCIIIAASGMATGGRVVHHLAQRLPHRRNTVILAGYQAAGTRGRMLAEGARQVKMLGAYVPVEADIVDIGGFSVHADRDELLRWSAPAKPGVVYCVHGEQDGTAAVQQSLEARGTLAVVPSHMEVVRFA